MKIKSKLISITVFSGLFLAVFIWMIICGSIRNIRQEEYIHNNIEELGLIIRLYSDINSQIRGHLFYIFFGGQKALQEFEKSGIKIKDNLKKWIDIRKENKGALSASLRDAEKLEKEYNEALEIMYKANELAGAGKEREAINLTEERIYAFTDILSKDINEIIAHKNAELNRAYITLLLNIELIPLLRGRLASQLTAAINAVNLYSYVAQIYLSIQSQGNKLLFYAASGEQADKKNFEDTGIVLKNDFQKWERILKAKMPLESVHLKRESIMLQNTKQSYEEFLQLSNEVFALRKTGKNTEAFKLIEEKIIPLFENNLLPGFYTELGFDEKENIDAHEAINESMLFSTFQKIFLQAVFLLYIIFIIFRLTKGIMRSLNRLNKGVAMVRTGSLDYRIDLKSKDEFGEFALVLNDMIENLQKTTVSRDSLVKEIAERKKTEETLRDYTKQVEKINKELDDFTYIVSHDLKEPLRSIDAFSKFIEDGYIDKLDEEGKYYLKRIRANANRMQSLIEDLLEVSRLEREDIKLDEVEIGELVEEAKFRLEYFIKQKNAEIIVWDKLPKIFCNRVRLLEVFVNLISNAIKFNDKPQPRIEISSRLKEGFYEFCIKDNGQGIEERYFDKIFEIFQRLGKRADNEGTGAGLTIAKKIIQIYKGKIWVESKIGQGAAFYFTIPKERTVIHPQPQNLVPAVRIQ